MQKIIIYTFFLFFVVNGLKAQDDSLRSKIGQMIMLGIDRNYQLPDSVKYDLQHRSLGGIIYFTYNIQSPAQIRELSNSIKSLAPDIPPFIALDQEGGTVARMNSKNGFEKTYTAYELGSVFKSVDSTRALAGKMAGWFRQCGANFNFAPAVDIMVNPSSPGLGDKGRLYSADADTVYNHVASFIGEFHNQKIITTLKHFPGHGSSSVDSHSRMPDLSDTWSEEELQPYRRLIADGYSDCIMAAHILNSRIDPIYPASVSYKTITGLLRGDLGYKGVVVTDELAMEAITDRYSIDKAAELAINAGADILLYRMYETETGTSLLAYLQNSILRKVKEGKISRSRIEESYNRIMELKKKYLSTTDEDESKKVKVPAGFALRAYPNPFNPETLIEAGLPEDAEISIKIYDIQGRLITELVNGFAEKGVHHYVFNASNLASGIYFARLISPVYSLSAKILLLR